MGIIVTKQALFNVTTSNFGDDNAFFLSLSFLKQMHHDDLEKQIRNSINTDGGDNFTDELLEIFTMSEEQGKPTRTLTQQGAAKNDRNALNRAKRHHITDLEIINKLAEMHSNPCSAQAVSEAAGAVLHTQANMKKECPLYDAVNAIVKERAALPNGQPAER